MSIIKFASMTFSYDGSHDKIFDNVSLQIDTDWKLGLVGRNGKGKTTLLRLLQGQYPCSGSIYSTVDFEYFPYTVEDNSQLVCEIVEGITPQFEQWKIEKELNLLDFREIDFYRSFGSYSNGEQTKILLAVLFSKDNTFLLIDEPTNHLDRFGREVLAKYLKKKSSYIIVSHDKRFLDNCIDHVMSINKCNIEVQSGNLSSYLQNKQMKDEFELSENEKLKCEISRLKEASRRTADWADKGEKEKFSGKQASGLKPDRGFIGAKAAGVMKRATVMKNRMADSIDEKATLLKNIDRVKTMSLSGEEFFRNRLLQVCSLVIEYNGREINQPISFEVCNGERVSLVGKNGCGKTSVIKAILGQVKTYSGEVLHNHQLKFSYVSQDTSYVRGTIEEFCSEHDLDKTALLTKLYNLGFERIQFEKLLHSFSEGQKKKLLIAKSLCEKANLYIWDEPLNFIDIISREQIQDMLLASRATMIFVEHDAEFCERVKTKEIEIIEK